MTCTETEWCGFMSKAAPLMLNILLSYNGEVSSGHLQIDDSDEDAYETFVMSLEHKKSFVKTGRNAYDVPVTAVLVLAKLVLGDKICVTTDGEYEEWEAGAEMVASVLGLDFAFDVDDGMLRVDADHA